MRLQGKAALITGAASGFGKATALRFCEEGASVVVADLDRAKAEETIAQLERSGGKAQLALGDVSTPEGAAGAIEACVSCFGRLDVLVNNVGISGGNVGIDSWNVTEDVWDRVLRINLKSVYLCTRAAIPAMLQAGGGSIVNVASIAVNAPVGGAAYAASKGGMLSYTRQVARELARRKVRLNCVSPGFMRTPMTTGERQGLSAEAQEQRIADFGKRVPMGRAGSVLDIANAIVYLASDEACYVTGQEIVVDGGYLVR